MRNYNHTHETINLNNTHKKIIQELFLYLTKLFNKDVFDKCATNKFLISPPTHFQRDTITNDRIPQIINKQINIFICNKISYVRECCEEIIFLK
jgi:hypothetical protein